MSQAGDAGERCCPSGGAITERWESEQTDRRKVDAETESWTPGWVGCRRRSAQAGNRLGMADTVLGQFRL